MRRVLAVLALAGALAAGPAVAGQAAPVSTAASGGTPGCIWMKLTAPGFSLCLPNRLLDLAGL